jgi:hypothetical protein
LGQRGGDQPELRDLRVGGATAITRSKRQVPRPARQAGVASPALVRRSA